MAEEKEIDLLDIFMYLANYVKRSKVLIISIFVVCIGLCLTYYYLSDVKYTSKMTIISSSVPFTAIEQIYEPLERSIKLRKQKLTAELLGVEKKDVEKIVAINLNHVKPDPALREVEGATFSVEFISVDKDIYPKLGDPTVFFFNSNEYIQRQTALQQKLLEAKHKEVKEQIERLDKVQKLIPKVIEGSEKKDIVVSDYNLGSLYQEMVNLKNEETRIVEDIELNIEFKLLSGFIVIEQKKGAIFYIAIGIILAISINVLILMMVGAKQLIGVKNS